jgi:hypothetical protein
MHEAIQEISRLLAQHLPLRNATPEDPATPARTIPVDTETEPQQETETEPVNAESTSAEEDTPKPSAEKRTSMLGAIGKVFWPFGASQPREEAGTKTPALGAPNLIQAPKATISEVVTSGPEIVT